MDETINSIIRKSDGKLFGVYFRTGLVTIDTHPEGTSHWISKFDDEELQLDYISSEEYEVKDTMADNNKVVNSLAISAGILSPYMVSTHTSSLDNNILSVKVGEL